MIEPSTLSQAAPAAGLGAMIVAGAALWLVGRRIARTAYASLGAMIGAGAAMTLSQTMGDHGMLPLWLIVGGVVGGALGWLLFRPCVAVCLALLLALAAPTAIRYAGHGDLPPVLPADTRESLSDARDDAEARAVVRCQDDLRQAYRSQVDADREWWDGLGGGERQILTMASMIGAIVGGIGGLIFPKLGGSLGTAMVGTLLAGAGAAGLLAIYAPGIYDRLPGSPAAVLGLLGLITLGGVIVQCTLLKRKADKR